jgi:hypothetical protein
MDEALTVMPAEAVALGHRTGIKDLPVDSRTPHPFDRRVGFVDQKLRQLRHRLAPGDPHQIGVEIVLGVGIEIDLVELIIGNLRQKRLFVFKTVMGVAELGARTEPGIAAPLLLRRLFQHHHLGAGAMRRICRRLRRVAEADDHHVAFILFHRLSSLYFLGSLH